MFCTTGLVSSKEEIYFQNCYLDGFGTFDLVTLTFGLMTPKSIGFLRHLKLLIGNGFGTFDPSNFDLWPSEPKIHRVPLLPRTSMWTQSEKGRSRRSRVIDRKWKGDRPTDVCKAVCPLFFEGGHNKYIVNFLSWCTHISNMSMFMFLFYLFTFQALNTQYTEIQRNKKMIDPSFLIGLASGVTIVTLLVGCM